MIVAPFLDLVARVRANCRPEGLDRLPRARDRADEARFRHSAAGLRDDVTHLAAPVWDHPELPLVETSNLVVSFEAASFVVDHHRVGVETTHYRLDVVIIEALDVLSQQGFLVDAHALLLNVCQERRTARGLQRTPASSVTPRHHDGDDQS